MSRIGSFVKQMGHYSIGSVATMMAGMVSYPILTRVLKVEEYGIMGAVGLLLNLGTGLSKMGLQFSLVRLWPEWDKKQGGRETFIFTMFVTMLTLTLGIAGLYLGITQLLRPWIGDTWTFFISIATPLIISRTLTSYGTTLLRSREMSKTTVLFEVVNTYTAMGLAVLGATTVIGGLTGYYVGVGVAEMSVVLVLMAYVMRWTRLSRQNLSFPLMREALTFGLPMAMFEVIGVLFYQADRFVILHILDETALGYYTAAYNIGWYINMVFTESVERAAVPVFSNLFENEGQEATSEFLRKAARFFFLFAFPAVAGLWAIREDLLVLLASEKFRPGSVILHLLLAGFLLYGSRTIIGAGMFLKKQPWKMAWLNVVGVTLNVALNFLLIPHYGIQGAAIATVVSQAILSVMFWIIGSRLVTVSIDLWALTRHAACAVAMAAVCHVIDPGPGVLRLVLRIGGGAAVFGVLLLAVDGQARGLALRLVGKLRRR